jgi:hypothetical protein
LAIVEHGRYTAIAVRKKEAKCDEIMRIAQSIQVEIIRMTGFQPKAASFIRIRRKVNTETLSIVIVNC